jgi:hypothetical protein
MPQAAAPGLQFFTSGGAQARAGLQEVRTLTPF